jgi:hypothetical protein
LKELLAAYSNVVGRELPSDIIVRRSGDVSSFFASAKKPILAIINGETAELIVDHNLGLHAPHYAFVFWQHRDDLHIHKF